MLTQTTEYALRAMACLASRPGELTPTPLLARETRVPANYLAKVLQSLAQADLIRGRRGVGGGYRLARGAQTITLLDVVNAIAPLSSEERVRLADEVQDVPHLALLHARLDEATASVNRQFSGVTLSDLVPEGASSRKNVPADDASTADDESDSQEAGASVRFPASPVQITTPTGVGCSMG